MNQPFSYVVSEELDRLLKEAAKSADETFLLKIKFASDLLLWEMRRIEAGGGIDLKACKTLGRIFDKFSADLLEIGLPTEVCERYNAIANRARNIVSKQSE